MYHLWIPPLFAYAAGPLESAAEIVKDGDRFIPCRPGRFNTAVGVQRRILIPWQTDANFHPFLVSFSEAARWLRT